jgi:hypothetical protein
MTTTGGCLCEALRFAIDAPIAMRGLCLCRTCQKISGGAGNLFIGLQADGFRYTTGQPARYAHTPDAPTREFCATCGVQIAGRSPRAPGGVIVKVGALDDPAVFEGPAVVVWTEEKQAFHHIPEGVPAFPRFPVPPPQPPKGP